MEPSINTQKIQAMKNYKRAKLGYSLALYSLTSIITCFFFSSPFWFPSITNHFFNISSFPTIISFCFNAKCLFLLGNLIVIILVGESKLKQSSSSTSDHFYDEYVARSLSRSSHHKETVDGSVKTLNVEEKIHHHQERKKKVEIKIKSMPRGGEEKKKGMRSCKSEVWGESGMVKMEKTKGKKEEQLFEGEKIKMGMRSSKSAVWSESETATAKMEKSKGKKEEQGVKASMMNIINGEEKKMGMRSSKSAVWSERVKMERGKGKKEEQSSKNITTHDHHQEVGMRSSRSAVWGESEIVERELKGKEEHIMQMGIMRSCRSESEIVRLGKTHVAKQEEEQQLNVLNKRVEDFIARVNNQRLLEAKIVDHIDS